MLEEIKELEEGGSPIVDSDDEMDGGPGRGVIEPTEEDFEDAEADFKSASEDEKANAPNGNTAGPASDFMGTVAKGVELVSVVKSPDQKSSPPKGSNQSSPQNPQDPEDDSADFKDFETLDDKTKKLKLAALDTASNLHSLAVSELDKELNKQEVKEVVSEA